MLTVLLPCLAAGAEIDKNRALGSPTAPVRLEIFSDFTCPHCRHLHEEVLPQLMKDYVIGGKVYVVDRAFPLTGPGHEHSREAFAYAVAAARIGKYEQVADALYAQQATWAINGNVWARGRCRRWPRIRGSWRKSKRSTRQAQRRGSTRLLR